MTGALWLLQVFVLSRHPTDHCTGGTAGGAACARPWFNQMAPPVIIFDTSVTGMGDGKSCLGDVKIDRALFMKGLPSVRSESKSFEGSEL